MTHGLSRGSFYWRSTTQVGKGSLAAQPVRVVSGNDHERSRRIRSYPFERHKFRRSFPHEAFDLSFEIRNLFGELPVAPSHGAQRELRRRCWVSKFRSAPET